MIDKIGHYSLTTPGSIYDEEALTALELAGRTAKKVNECVEQVNENTKTVKEAKEYMVDNLPIFVENEIDELHDSGELTTMLVRAVASGKVDKGGNEQITYGMLAQDVKEAMTGGNTPVVGENSVNTANIVDGAVNIYKLVPALRALRCHVDKSVYHKPLIKINLAEGTAVIDTTINFTYWLYSEGTAISLVPSETVVDTSQFTRGNTSFSLYYHAETKVLYLTNFNVLPTVTGCYSLGKLNSNKQIQTNVITVEVNGVIYTPGDHDNVCNAPNLFKPMACNLWRYAGDPRYAFFNIDTVARTVTLVNPGSSGYHVQLGGGYVTLNWNTVTLDFSRVGATATYCFYYFDNVTNSLIFQGNSDNIPSNWLYLGFIHFTAPHVSESMFPFTIDKTYVYSPKEDTRAEGKLVYRPFNDGVQTVPYVDYKNKVLVFPSCRALYLISNSSYFRIKEDDGTYPDFTVPIDAATGYNYLVGGVTETGAGVLKFITADEFVDLKRGLRYDEHFAFGCVNIYEKHADLNFPVVEGASVSFLGDSITTCEGYIPEENEAYYSSNVEYCWFKKVMRGVGLSLNKNNSYSGMLTSNFKSSTINGMEFAKALDNGTTPDNIVVFMGHNDFIQGVDLGTYDGRGPIPTNGDTFREAYAIMLRNIMERYPGAKVYACTLIAHERNTGVTGQPEANSKGVYLFEYNEAIREIATRMHVEVIDMATCAINPWNGEVFGYDWSDATGAFLHPGAAGHTVMANKAIQTMKYGRNW